MTLSKDNKNFTALFLTAHCDDAELWAGGTICKYIDAGWEVVVGISYYDEQRKIESTRCAQNLNYKILFRDRDIDLREWIKNIIEANQPTVLFTHQEQDLHLEHRMVFRETLAALTKTKTRKKYPIRWYVYDTYYLSVIPFASPFLIDISKFIKKKTNALKFHVSQKPEQLIKMVIHINALHGQKIRVQYAEAFYPFSLLGRWPRFLDIP